MKKAYRLLIVDDSEELIDAFNEFFSSMGYEVVTARDGFAALKLVRETTKKIDLIITDLVMPNISGVGLISIIKKEYPGLATVAMTGYGDHPGALASEAEADLIFYKPLNLYDIEKEISVLLEKQT
ncbi:MAG: response regulator [Desulfobacteraceae bacterium]